MDISTLTAAAADVDRYGLEVLCANWTPMAAVIAAPASRAREWLADAAGTDIEGFLTRFYHAQRG